MNNLIALLVVLLVADVALIATVVNYRSECRHLKHDNERLEEQLKRALPLQQKIVQFGTDQSERRAESKEAQKSERVKLPGRKTWSEIAEKLEYLASPEAVLDGKLASREAVKKEIEEAVNG